MSRRIFCLLCAFPFFLSGAVYGGDMEKLRENLERHVVKLSDEIGERNYVYYDSLCEAAEYIIAEFKEYGYEPRIQSYAIGKRSYSNIIAERTGSVSPGETVIIGAHYDSVIGSPGANDNASGVGALLELARLFSGVDVERTVKFIAFVNEEPPFFLSEEMGSQVYAAGARTRGEDIRAMIALETIGYYSEERNSQNYPWLYGLFYPDQANFIAVVGNFGSRGLVKKVKDTFKKNSEFNIESVVAPSIVPGVDFSDHASFWQYGYKACMVTDTAFYRYPYYHTAEDTHEKIDHDRLAEVTRGFYHVLLELSRSGK